MEINALENPLAYILFQCPICSQNCLVVVDPNGTLVVLDLPFSLHIFLPTLICQEMVYDVRLFI